MAAQKHPFGLTLTMHSSQMVLTVINYYYIFLNHLSPAQSNMHNTAAAPVLQSIYHLFLQGM